MKIPRYAFIATIPCIAIWTLGACSDDEDNTQPAATSTSSVASSTTGPGGSGGSGGETTTGPGGAGGAGGSGGGMPDVVLSNTPANCQNLDYIFPILPAEASHVAAARLTPADTPFTVKNVSYTLAGQSMFADCDGSLAHRVDVWVQSWDPNDPYPVVAPSMQSVHASFSVPADSAALDPGRTVELTLDPPITLQADEVLFVGVELAANRSDTASLCIESCSDTMGISGLDYWSNASSEPYDSPGWSDMVADYGFTSNFTISAAGQQR